MKLLGLNLTATKAATSDELGAQLGALDKVRVEAQREFDRLAAMRTTLLVTASDAELQTHDRAMETERRNIERVDAQRAALQPQWQAADRQEEQARRKAIYTRGQKARVEAVKVLAQYPAAARALADILSRFAQLEAEIEQTNHSLPDGAEPIESAEPFRGQAARPGYMKRSIERVPIDVRTGERMGAVGPSNRQYLTYREVERQEWVGPVSGFRRAPLIQDVHLPAVDPDEPAFW